MRIPNTSPRFATLVSTFVPVLVLASFGFTFAPMAAQAHQRDSIYTSIELDDPETNVREGNCLNLDTCSTKGATERTFAAPWGAFRCSFSPVTPETGSLFSASILRNMKSTCQMSMRVPSPSFPRKSWNGEEPKRPENSFPTP